MAIRPEDKPMEEFERQLRQLNEQLEEDATISSPPPGGYFANNNASKSLPDIADYKNYQQPMYDMPTYGQDEYGNPVYPPRYNKKLFLLTSLILFIYLLLQKCW